MSRPDTTRTRTVTPPVTAARPRPLGVETGAREAVHWPEVVSQTSTSNSSKGRVAPTAMIMCPCVDGLSHNEAEEISPEWAEAGANVLFHAVVETAEIVE